MLVGWLALGIGDPSAVDGAEVLSLGLAWLVTVALQCRGDVVEFLGQVFLVADIVCSANQGLLDGGLDSGVMKGAAVQVSVGMGGFAVDTASKTSIRLSCHLNIKKGDAAISFLFHCELDVAVQCVEVF